MSEPDLRRIEVLSEVRRGRRTVAGAAAVVSISERQAYRLLSRCELDGGAGLIHKARGLAQLRFVSGDWVASRGLSAWAILFNDCEIPRADAESRAGTGPMLG